MKQIRMSTERCALYFMFLLQFICISAVSYPDRDYKFTEGPEFTRVLNRTNNDLSIYKTCEQNKCFAKCCQRGQIFNENRQCINSDLKFNFTEFDGIYSKDNCDFNNITECERTNINDDNYFNIILQGTPNCSNKIMLNATEFKLLDTGSIIENYMTKESNIGSQCIELFETGGEIIPINILCYDPESIESTQEGHKIYLGMFVSVAFLIATFLVYAIVPDLQNLHGKSLMNHCATLGTGYFFLAVLQMDVEAEISNDKCIILSYIVIFSFLASFFWLNVMCFDIWWVFSGYRPPAASSKKEIEKKKFIFYSIYSWGISAIIFCIILLMEMSWVPKHFIRPEFGLEKCWFKTKIAEFYYFYLPLAFILGSNLLFFILTTCRIIKISKETKILTRGENKRSEDHERQRFILYLKLFIVMGVNWIAELASFFSPELNDLWYITDAANALQGVLIFIIFVCKRRIFRLLKMRLSSKISSTNGLSKTPKSTSNISTRHTSFTSNTESVRIKSVSSIPNINISKTPM